MTRLVLIGAAAVFVVFLILVGARPAAPREWRSTRHASISRRWAGGSISTTHASDAIQPEARACQLSTERAFSSVYPGPIRGATPTSSSTRTPTASDPT